MSFRNLQHFATLGLTECKDALVRIFLTLLVVKNNV